MQLNDRSRTRPISQVGLTIDLGQYKNKNDYYHNLKIQLGTRHDHKLGGST